MTARVALATDSTADLEPGLLQQNIVAMVPLVINWDRQSYRDKVDLSSDEFYRRLRGAKSLPKTGAPSLAAFEEAFRRQLDGHEAVVSINLSGRLSTTLDVARQAAEAVDAGRVSVLDSGTFTRGLGWMLEAAAGLADAGAGPEDIARAVAEMRPRVRIVAILDTLEYLQRGGRIGRAAALAGTLLSVKPLLEITDGEVRPLERVRTLGGAIRRLVEIVVGMGDVERLAVMHGDAAASARELERQLQPHLPRLTIEHGEIGSVLRVHAGPGVFGVAVLLAR